MATPTEFFLWWIVDERTSKMQAYSMTRRGLPLSCARRSSRVVALLPPIGLCNSTTRTPAP